MSHVNNCEKEAVKHFQQNGIRIGMISDPGRANLCLKNETHCEPGVKISKLIFETLGIPEEKRYYGTVL